ELRIVHRNESLQRRIGPLASRAENLAAGRVQDLEVSGRGDSLPERVKGAPIKTLALILVVVACVGNFHRDRFPNSFGLVGLDGRPADLRAGQARARRALFPSPSSSQRYVRQRRE